MGIYEKLNIIRSAKADICQAILGKSPSVPPTDDIRQWPTAIASISGGSSPSASKNDVVFRDCDGTILHSYTADEVASMTELPALPTREGLTCQEWNWTLAHLKELVSSRGVAEVGAVYTTDDGSTRIRITIKNPVYSTITLAWNQSTSNGVVVDWGDESDAESVASTGNQSLGHTYEPSSYPAQYNIKMTIASGTVRFYTNILGRNGNQSSTNATSVWMEMVDEVHIGQGVTQLGSNFLQDAINATIVTLPLGVASIGASAFGGCSSLRHITLPSSVASIGYRGIAYCRMLQSVSLPYGIQVENSEHFRECLQLKSLVVPDGAFTSIPANFLRDCYSLEHVSLPSAITAIGDSALYDCCSLSSMDVPDGVTSIGQNAFYYCYKLRQLVLPDSVETIGDSAFVKCESIYEMVLPKSITSIGASLMQANRCLMRVQIPASIADIGASAFRYCYGLKTFDFRRSTSVPTLANVNAFAGTPEVKEIVVPDELYDNWIAASNWNSSTNQIKKSIVKASESSLGSL